MKAHIAETLKDVDARISELQTFRTSLLAFFRDDQVPALYEAAVPTAAAKPVKLRIASTPRKPRVTKPSPGPQANITAAFALPEPFMAKDLAKAAALTYRAAASQIDRWKKAKMIERVGFGQYRRTAKFPAAQAAEPASAPQADRKPQRGPLATAVLQEASRADLEKKLEDACKQRDQANANGRDKIAAIYQSEIDKLQTQLDQL